MSKIIGITGSIGMGKSTIAYMLSKLGIPVFDSDKEVADILKNNRRIIKEVHIKWPQVVIIDKNKKRINKKVLGDKVFSNLASKNLLNKIGFKKEGKLRKYLKINGEWQDHVLYSLLE